MTEGWYELVNADVPITQGDLIFSCPVIGWQSDTIDLQGKEYTEVLDSASDVISADVVVLTQACDLEHSKVANVILCPHFSLKEYKSAWETEMKNRNNNPSPKAWRSHCSDICDGFIWNLAMLNSFENKDYKLDIRVVDFHDIFTIPRIFLESLLKQRDEYRFRLLPPYREHLSQAFARFFMRVGLPIEISKEKFTIS
ncbi:MAG: hypothetical protein JRI95_09725 [Deltaproteobacteria bacterium]|nr:hypothetical protein [Deltaproteobacteria bacterium]MBW2085181.1 hypothetical protein [Deltaproteobacteria bacterium]